MGRKPGVFVRDTLMLQGQKAQRIIRTAKYPVKLPGAIVVLLSAQGQSAADVARLLRVSDVHGRDVIHACDEHRSHTEQDAAIGAYIRWHHRHAEPKRTLAPNSKTRYPVCPT